MTAQTVVYHSPPGVDLPSLAGLGWLIEGIAIDNPSGSWLHVSGIEQYVPPYTQGWSASVKPAQSSISVTFTASPAGQPSSNVGNPIRVILSNQSLGDSPGISAGPSNVIVPGADVVRVAPTNAQLAIQFLTTNAAPNTTDAFAMVPVVPPASRFVIWAAHMTGWRVLADVIFLALSLGGGTDIAYLSISPNNRNDHLYLPGGLGWGNVPISVAYSSPSASQSFGITIEYSTEPFTP